MRIVEKDRSQLMTMLCISAETAEQLSNTHLKSEWIFDE